jgi:hypothetical protein
MLRSIPRSKRHELMLLWCRTPVGVGLMRKIGAKGWAKLSRVALRLSQVLGASKAAPSGTEADTWVSPFVGQLIDENVKSVLILGAAANDGITATLMERARSADCSIVTTTDPAAQIADFDCIVIRDSAAFGELGMDAVNSARLLVVCGAESFNGYQIVSRVLSESHWELTGSTEDVWDGCVVFRRMESQSRGAWEILDVLHRKDTAVEHVDVPQPR